MVRRRPHSAKTKKKISNSLKKKKGLTKKEAKKARLQGYIAQAHTVRAMKRQKTFTPEQIKQESFRQGQITEKMYGDYLIKNRKKL